MKLGSSYSLKGDGMLLDYKEPNIDLAYNKIANEYIYLTESSFKKS